MAIAPRVITDPLDKEFLVARGNATLIWDSKTKRVHNRDRTHTLNTEFKTRAEARTMLGRFNVRVV